MRTSSARRVGQVLGLGTVAMLVAGLLQASVAVKAQEPNPNDPLSNVPVHWYVNPADALVIGPPLLSFGAAESGVKGFWELQFDWANWDQFWLQWQQLHPATDPLHFGPVGTGVVAATFSSSRPLVTWAAGIWEANKKGAYSPAKEFKGIDVQFWRDLSTDGIYDPGSSDTALGSVVKTNHHGDAHCPAGAPCPFSNTPPLPPYGVQFRFSISLDDGTHGCGAGGQNTPPPPSPGSIAHYFTVHGRDMNNDPTAYHCLNSLAGQVWNCLANSNCAQFE